LEEICTLGADPLTQQRFIEAICLAVADPLDPVRVVFTLRDDFLGRVAVGEEMIKALSHVTVLRRPGPGALSEILNRPLAAAGYRYDDETLVNEMVEAIAGEAACLPLVQFTAHALWEKRDRERRVLRRADYGAMGGVEGALADHADGVFQGLSAVETKLAREILLRLVTPEGTRKVLSRTQALEGLDPRAGALVDRLVDARLLTQHKGRAQVTMDQALELTHESLIHRWDRLANWIEESREERKHLAELAEAASLWDKRGRRLDELWQSDALIDARRTLTPFGDQAPALVAQFVDAGARLERGRRRRRRAIVALAFALVVLVAVGFAAKERETRQQKTVAENERALAQSERATAQREGARAASRRGQMVEARAKLRGSLETQDSPEARALWWTLSRHPLYWRKVLGAVVYDVIFSRDGNTLFAASQDKSIYALDVRTARFKILRGHGDQVIALATSADGNLLASGDWSGQLGLWRLKTGTGSFIKAHPGAIRKLAFDRTGHLLASVGDEKTIQLWDVSNSRRMRLLKGHDGVVRSVSFSPDGKTLVSAGFDGTARIWDVTSGRQKAIMRGHAGVVRAIAIDPSGTLVATASVDWRIRLWRMADASLVKTLLGHTADIRSLSFAPGGRYLASASFDNSVRLWDVERGEQVRVLSGHTSTVLAVSYSPRGDLVASASADKSIRVWRASGEIDLTLGCEQCGAEASAAGSHGYGLWRRFQSRRQDPRLGQF
jgi:hypothetical protein